MRLLPPLHRRHPSMVLAATATAFMHLTFGVQPERYTDESFDSTFRYLPIKDEE